MNAHIIFFSPSSNTRETCEIQRNELHYLFRYHSAEAAAMDCDRRGSSSSADSSVLFPTYLAAANSLTQLYNESMNMQKEAFRAGEKNALEQIRNWMLTKMQDGAIMSVNEISVHLKTMLYPNNEPSPRSTVDIQDITPESEALPLIGVEQPKLKYKGYESMSVDLNVPYNPDVPGY